MVQLRLPVFLRRFAADTRGQMSLEMALWAPLILSLFMAIIDFAVTLTVNANMWHATRMTARALSQHRIPEQDAEDHLREQLLMRGLAYDVAVEIDRNEVSVGVTLPEDEAGLTPFYRIYGGGDMRALTRMYREPI